MVLELDKCFKLFEIDMYDKTINEDILRKKYHKLCLKYHPDKNNDNSGLQFLQVKESYEILLKYYKQNEVLENDKDDNLFYNFVKEMVNVDTIDKILQMFEEYFIKQKNIITYHVELSQLFRKDIYYNSEYQVYIPLWHKYIKIKDIYNSLDNIDQKNNKKINSIFIIKIRNIPSNIKILENNDIIIYMKNEHLNLNNTFNYYLCDNKILKFKITDKIIKDKFHVCLNEGIPRTNVENVYDFSILSHIIFCF